MHINCGYLSSYVRLVLPQSRIYPWPHIQPFARSILSKYHADEKSIHNIYVHYKIKKIYPKRCTGVKVFILSERKFLISYLVLMRQLSLNHVPTYYRSEGNQS